jgi:hypothetical protein
MHNVGSPADLICIASLTLKLILLIKIFTLRQLIIQNASVFLNFGSSDRCRRSSLVATPKIIHRMIFVCDIMHSAFYIHKAYE